MEDKGNLHLTNLAIAGEWTARDFVRMFGMLDEANSIFTVLHLGRATVVDAPAGRSTYLRRISRKDDPQVVVEGVQFGSPGNIQAWFPWKEVLDFLLKLCRPASETDRALKEEQVKQARAQTEALELDNRRRQVAIERELNALQAEKIQLAALQAERLRLAETGEQAAFDGLCDRFGDTAMMLLIIGFRRKSGAPYTVIADYFGPRVDAVESALQDFQQRGLLTGITPARTQLPAPEGEPPAPGDCA